MPLGRPAGWPGSGNGCLANDFGRKQPRLLFFNLARQDSFARHKAQGIADNDLVIEGEGQPLPFGGPKCANGVVTGDRASGFHTCKVGDGHRWATRVAPGLGVDTNELQDTRVETRLFLHFPAAGRFTGLVQVNKAARQCIGAFKRFVTTFDQQDTPPRIDNNTVDSQQRCGWFPHSAWLTREVLSWS